MKRKQVNNAHYSFRRYVHKNRWLSIWHQLDEVLSLSPDTLLELGPGPGLLKALAGHYGIIVKTVDIDPELEPDCVASATDLPFKNNSYDCVCAFQMLEHLPYNQSLRAFGEMSRVAKKHIVISLPDDRTLWTYAIYIPKLGQKIIHLPKPRLKKRVLKPSSQHFWEINRQGYPLQKIITDFSEKKVELMRTYRVKENPYHRFFIFSKKDRSCP